MLIKKIQKNSNNLAEKIAQKLVRYPILAPVALLLIILLVTPFALLRQSPVSYTHLTLPTNREV